MAKSRRINEPATREAEPRGHVATSPSTDSRLFTRAVGQRLAIGMFAAALTYVAFWPHDSVEVQQGSARYLVAWLILNAFVAVISYAPIQRNDWAVDLIAWLIPGWMTISLLANRNAAELRLGINELGWWIATAASLSIARRIACDVNVANHMLRLSVVLSLGVALFGWHQWLVGIPNMIAEYKADPDTMLKQIGIVAEEGSAMRIVFENRLYDGGPTGTFALANSMAVMLLGGFVAMVGLMAREWRGWSSVRCSVWLICIVIVGGMLLAARSRAAVLALVFVSGGSVFVYCFSAQVFQRLRLPSIRIVLLVVFAMIAVAGATFVFSLRDSEWLSQAPASIAIRLNYWRACVGMLQESPWFGLGPGQFKANYELYRVPASNEQIADPHQFLLQVATAGGIPAAVLLGMLLAVLAWRYVMTSKMDSVADDAKQATARSVWLGAGTAVIGVWFVGAALAQLPVPDAGLLATIGAIVFALGFWYCSPSMSSRTSIIAPTAACSMTAMAVALLASGGITVPGVSLFAWMFAGVAVPISLVTAPSGQQASQRSSQSDAPKSLRERAFEVLLVGGFGLLLLAWYQVGITPIEKVNLQENRFELAWSQGQVDSAVSALEEAGRDDPYSVQPWLQLASVSRTLSVAQSDQRTLWNALWRTAELNALTRAPHDPVVLKQLADNWVIHFQRYGEQPSLKRASELYERVVARSPSHEAYTAQWAAILQGLDDPRASDLAVRADALSREGGYYERLLEFTAIFPAIHVGESIAREPVQRRASEVLGGLLKSSRSGSTER